MRAFVNATFSGAERHRRRLGEVLELEREQHPNPLKALHEAGQSIWLDYIRRALLETGTLARYISGLWVTGLTSNPTIFEHAIAGSGDYDDAIARRLDRRLSTEELFFEIALEDILAAADLFRPVYEATGGADGFVSLEASPTLADDTEGTIAEAKRLHGQAARPNVLIKVPGTNAGVVAIEELIAAGIPINVTLLFSREHYLAAADAYLKGLERRVEKGASRTSPRSPRCSSRAGTPLPRRSCRRLCAIAWASRSVSAPSRRTGICSRPSDGGASGRPGRGRSGCCGRAPAPRIRPCPTPTTSRRSPPKTRSTPCQRRPCLAFGRHGSVGALLSTDTTDAEAVIAGVEQAGIDVAALAEELQIKARDLSTICSPSCSRASRRRLPSCARRTNAAPSTWARSLPRPMRRRRI